MVQPFRQGAHRAFPRLLYAMRNHDIRGRGRRGERPDVPRVLRGRAKRILGAVRRYRRPLLRRLGSSMG